MQQSGPEITSTRRGRDLVVVVKHREFIGDVNGSEDFFLSQFAVNPGLAETFPWLNEVAQNFESYHFRYLRFQYQPQAPTTAPGTVMLAIDYDAADTAPTEKIELMSLVGAVRCAVWSEIEQRSTADDLKKMAPRLYVRTTNLASNLDIKTYDVGNLFIATVGATAITVGELYVEYEVELTSPTWEGQVDEAASWSSTWATGEGGTSPMDLTPFNGTRNVKGSLPMSTLDSDKLVFGVVGTFMVTYFTNQASNTVQNASEVWTADTGCDTIQLYPTTTDGAVFHMCQAALVVDVHVVGATVTFRTPSNTNTTLTASSVTVSPFAAGIEAKPPIGPALKGKSGPYRWLSRTKVFCPFCQLKAKSCVCGPEIPRLTLQNVLARRFLGSMQLTNTPPSRLSSVSCCSKDAGPSEAP
jgi:hypothetical protein